MKGLNTPRFKVINDLVNSSYMGVCKFKPVFNIGGPLKVGFGNGGFASRPRGRNRLIGKNWRRSYSDRRSAWTATRRESHMFHVSSNLQINLLKRDHELGSPEKHGTQHRVNETSWETTELRQSSNETQNGETVS